MFRALVIFALLHGTIFVGAGSALEHIFHELDAASGSAEHHHHGGHHGSADGSSTAVESAASEDWINCVFCLDGVGGTGIEFASIFDERRRSELFHQTTPRAALQIRVPSFLARAPPGYS